MYHRPPLTAPTKDYQEFLYLCTLRRNDSSACMTHTFTPSAIGFPSFNLIANRLLNNKLSIIRMETSLFQPPYPISIIYVESKREMGKMVVEEGSLILMLINNKAVGLSSFLVLGELKNAKAPCLQTFIITNDKQSYKRSILEMQTFFVK